MSDSWEMWNCPKCGYKCPHSYRAISDVGNPVCPNCDTDMEHTPDTECARYDDLEWLQAYYDHVCDAHPMADEFAKKAADSCTGRSIKRVLKHYWSSS